MSCIIATLTFLGMWAMGVPYPMVIGLLAAITEWIPIVGPIVGAVPAILLSATVSLSLPIKVIILTVPVTAVLQILCKHLWFYNTYKEKAMKHNGNNENRNQ